MRAGGDHVLAKIAEEHHGVFATPHVRAAGLTKTDSDSRVAARRWIVIHRGVYRLAGAPLSWRGTLLAACWAGGSRAAASHRSAAKLWGLPGGREDLVEIICPRWRRARHEDLNVHETIALGHLDLTELDKIPVTTAERTLLDLGAACSPRTVEMAFENALRRDLVSTESLRGLLRRLGRQGRNGAGVLRSILDERDPARAPTESEMETRLLQVLKAHGLPTPVPQYEIRDGLGHFIARVDLAFVDWRVALEYESIQEHTGKAALLRDNPRRRRIMGVGWKPIGVTVEDVRDGGFRLCAEILAVRRAY
jgi:predicted transcriptional regulator of viral defense system